MDNRTEEAIRCYAALLGDQQRVLGGEDPDTLETRLGLGNCLGRAEEWEAAIHHLRGLVDARQRLQGPDHPETLFARDFLAHWLAKAGRLRMLSTNVGSCSWTTSESTVSTNPPSRRRPRLLVTKADESHRFQASQNGRSKLQ